jgi:hypothetical protein
MQVSKTKLQRYFILFTPSSLGLVFYVFLAGLGIVLNQFDMIKKYLELPHSLQVTHSVTGWVDQILTTTIGESGTGTFVVGLFWAVVGLVVYMFLRALARLAVELDDNLNARGFVWPKGANRYRPIKIFIEQAAFRLVASIALLIFVLGPLAAVLRGPVYVDFLGPSEPLQYVVWFVAGLLSWHIVVVLLRLITLRPRLLG